MAEIIDVWNPNDGEVTTAKSALLPTTHAFNEDTYVAAMSAQPSGQQSTIEKAISDIAKGLSAPPSAYSMSNASTIPDQVNSGIIQWPGLNPTTLNKIATENIAPQLIINMRVDDVLRYSQYSSHAWRPGWKLEMLAHDKNPNAEDRKEIIRARKYLENSNSIDASVLDRDGAGLDGFQHFLAKLVRDSFIFDGVAIWRKLSKGNSVIDYKLMPAGNIRLVDPTHGYQGDKKVFAVLLDQSGNVAKVGNNADARPITFTREQLVWYVRNPRADAQIRGYGYPEIEQSVKLISAYQNVLDLNCDTFTKNQVPNGMLLLKGATFTQRQVDVLQKMWRNLLSGMSKRWALPVLATPKDGDIELIKLNDLTGTDTRYEDFLNMVAGGLATLFRFPVQRLGYRMSGKGPDSTPSVDSSAPLVDDDDPGLSPLLMHIEHIINQYLLWPNFPTLKFVFCGKSPKQDAREYQMRIDAMTWAESRAEVDLPTIDTLLEKVTGDLGVEADDEQKSMFALLAMASNNPNMSGVYQSVVAAFIKGKQAIDLAEHQQDEVVGNQISGGKDPANRAAHGHTAGVRRDSKAEASSAKK